MTQAQPAKVRMSKNLVITRKVAKNPVTWPISYAGRDVFIEVVKWLKVAAFLWMFYNDC